MISQIGLTNFKCFKGEHNFPLSKFNLLTGINGKGKSSFLQSLLLMKQTTDYDKTSNYIVLNGSCVQLGSFEDIKNSSSKNDEPLHVSFKIGADKSQLPRDVSFVLVEININYILRKDIEDEYIAIVDTYSVEIEHQDEDKTTVSEARIYNGNDEYNIWYYGEADELNYDFNEDDVVKSSEIFTNLIPNNGHRPDTDVSGLEDLFKRIQFISADRIGPKNYYEIQNINKEFSWVGSKGENTPSILLKKKDSDVHQALYLGEDANTLLQQTEEWLNFIFDGAKISITTAGEVILISYNTKQGRERYKPSNVGFGYSYILPIVVAGLIAQNGEILIIENPEAHLHPRAQHKLTQFLAKVAATGVQIFVESHSEHILNALRICTIEQEGQEKILSNTDLSILYFQDNETTPCVRIPIDEKGGIEEWPEGFFDQTDKDFKILFGF
jgi:predicted ATPase